MTTSIDQLGTWIKTEENKIVGIFQTDEAMVIAWAQPLIAQIVASANALGKATFAEGLQVLKDAAEAAVKAGAEALPTGNVEAVGAAAAAAFLATGASEGITVIKNAEAGAIKIAVAAAQTAATSVTVVTDPTEATPVSVESVAADPIAVEPTANA